MSKPKLATITSLREHTGWRPPRPQETAELDGVFRIRRLLEPELAAKACLLHSDTELDALEASLAALPTRDDVRALGRGARAWLASMLAPATTAWDLRVLTPLWEATDRCLWARSSWLGLVAPPAGGLSPRQELLASFHSRDPRRARVASRRQLDDEARRVRVCS